MHSNTKTRIRMHILKYKHRHNDSGVEKYALKCKCTYPKTQTSHRQKYADKGIKRNAQRLSYNDTRKKLHKITYTGRHTRQTQKKNTHSHVQIHTQYLYPNTNRHTHRYWHMHTLKDTRS